MKKYRYILLISLLLIYTQGWAQLQDERTESLDKLVLSEVNFLRTRPAEYAEARLSDDFKEKIDNGAYRFLLKMKPVGPLTLNDTLNTLAANYAKLISFKKTLSHNLRGNPMNRANKAGYHGMIGENLAAGSEDKYNALEYPQEAAIEFVRMLVIDRGVKDLGHRKILTEPRFREMGVGFQRDPNDKLKNYFVQEFGTQQRFIR